MVGLDKGRFIVVSSKEVDLAAEAVQCTSLSLQGIHHIHGGDGLPLGVFRVGDRIPDDVLQENLEDTTGLLVNEAGDTFDSTTTSQTTDGGFGNTLDVVSQNLAMTFGTSLPQPLASLSTTGHVEAL